MVYSTLQKNGYILKRIFRGIRFRQSKSLAKYTDMNKEMRIKAKSKLGEFL